MRAVIQRVTCADVRVDGEISGAIGPGMVIFIGIGKNDVPREAEYLAEKIANLRIFAADGDSGMDLAITQQQGYKALVVSQFTLFGDCRKGRRPSFSNAAGAERAVELYEYFIECLVKCGVEVQTGRFQTEMAVTLQNWGPVTLLLDSKREF